MKQVVQSLRTGETAVIEVPAPSLHCNSLLIRSSVTLISSGTEKMLVDFGRANLISKALQQPDKVRAALEKAKVDGVGPTLAAISGKLSAALPLVYGNVGRVDGVGGDLSGTFSVGDRVVSNGHHAEIVSARGNLCCKIPENVTDESASFAIVGAIALQGIRLAEPSLGETVVVFGLGLIGLLTVQLLRANGCRVIAVDAVDERLRLAETFGASVVDISNGRGLEKLKGLNIPAAGADVAIIAASTKENSVIHDAAEICRKRGRIVLVGVVGLKLIRNDFYEKELSFQVSSSYGPGRYDRKYEDLGIDYPVGFVRWTAKRNIEAVLELIGSGAINVHPLISHNVKFESAEEAYNIITGNESSLGVLLRYPPGSPASLDRTIHSPLAKNRSCGPGVCDVSLSFIGSGSFVKTTLLKAFLKTGAKFDTVVSNSGLSSADVARRFGFLASSTDSKQAMTADSSNSLVIATRHDSHAQLVEKALRAGKNIYLEKPLCLNVDELTNIENLYYSLSAPPILMVGFNRRFAPHVIKIKQLINAVSGPKCFQLSVNSGYISSEHWINDKIIGGGRLIGEGCHFLDLIRFLSGSPVKKWSKSVLGHSAEDTFSLHLSFEDGSIATINYWSNGPKNLSKERLEIFSEGGALLLDNYRVLRGYKWPGFKQMRLFGQDKGHKAAARAFVDGVRCGEAPIPVDEIFEVSRLVLEIAE